MRITTTRVLVGLLIVAGATIAHDRYRLHEAREARHTAELSLDSAEAAHSETIEMYADALDGTVRLFSRRVVQLRGVSDSLDAELDRETRARISTEARVEDMRVDSVLGTTEEGEADTTYARFDFRREPYEVESEVRISPRPPVLRMSISLDSIPLGIRVSCAEEAREGREVREAFVSLTAPEWADVTVREAEQDADVCNPRSPSPSTWDRLEDAARWGVVGGGAAYVTWRIVDALTP